MIGSLFTHASLAETVPPFSLQLSMEAVQQVFGRFCETSYLLFKG